MRADVYLTTLYTGTASEESNVTTGAAVPDRVGWDEIKRKNARKRAAK